MITHYHKLGKKYNTLSSFAPSFALFAVKMELNIKKISISFACILFLFSSAYCQNEKLSESIISIAEELAEDESDPEAVSIFIEELQELAEKPASINSGDESEISRLFFLADFQIRALANHIRSSGKIVSIYEIAGIPGFDRQSAEMIIPFITLESKNYEISKSLRLRNTLLSNLCVKPGEKDTSTQGSQLKILTKYKFTTGNFEGGFTSEKDAGEKVFSGTPPIPDFLSVHLAWSGKGVIRKIIIGDFAARFGQGTNICSGIRTALSLTAPGYMPVRNEIKTYTSTDENNFFRGAAAELSFRKSGLFIFWSNNKIDATIESSEDSSGFIVENLYLTGLHNTSSSLIKKDVLTEITYGMNYTYNLRFLKAGVSWSENRFSLPFISKIDNPEDLYDFTGTRNRILSVYYNSMINKILLFGEASLNMPVNYAFVQGITLRPSDRLIINSLYRYYAPGFISFHGKGTGSGGSTSNERGLLGNFTFEAAKHLFISAGCDLSRHQWLKYRCSFPSQSKREEFRLKYLPSDNFAIDVSYNYRYTMFNNVENNGIAAVKELKDRTIKTQVKYSLSESFSLTSRIDYKISEPAISKGMLLCQDVNFRFRKLPITVWLRYCIFNTDDWNSRLYIYENDLLYSFSIPALSGEGNRSYVMIKWEMGDFAELRVKYCITSQIENSSNFPDKDELRMQFRVKF